MEASRDTLPTRHIYARRAFAAFVASAALAGSAKLMPILIRDGKKIGADVERRTGWGEGGMVSPPPAPSLDELGGLPAKKEVAGPKDGFDDLSLRANPDADMYVSGAVMVERRYLRHELEQRTGRTTLWPGDALDVPVLPEDK